MTVTPLGRDQDCSLKNREPDVPASWFLDPGGWSKTAAVSLYFIFPGICTLSLHGDLPDGEEIWGPKRLYGSGADRITPAMQEAVRRITHYQAMLLNPERIQFGTVTSLNRATLLSEGEAEAAVEHNCLVGLMIEED
ncbi:hypothetical protein STEG23_003924 [Scotinomys teguina]